MRPLLELAPEASKSFDEFRARFDHPFLVHCRTSGALQPVDRTRGLTIDRAIIRGSAEHPSIPTTADYSIVEVVSRSNRPDKISIGCSSRCDIQLNDASVSKIHATLRRDGSGWIAVDEESLTGLLVNEGDPDGPLRSGDRITFGSVDLVFMLPAEMHQLLRGLCRK